MKATRLTAALLIALLSFLFGVGFSRLVQGKVDDKPKEGWVDYDDLDQKDRLKERPGNFQLLGAISDYLTGMYKVRPDLSMCAFPFQSDSKTIDSLAQAEKALDEAAKGRTQQNGIRQYNLNIRSLTVYDPDEMIKSVQTQKKAKFSEYHVKRLQEVRKRHPGRAALVLANLPIYSLQSPKIEGGEAEEIVFYLVHTRGQWKVAWFDK